MSAEEPTDFNDDASWNVLDMLRSGHAPTSATFAGIPGRVAVLQQRQQLLNLDIVRLEALILRKREAIASAEAEIDQTNSLAAPIRSIPKEILLDIFSLLFESDGSDLDPNSAPDILGHICKSWRTISRSSRSLWTRLDLRGTYRLVGHLDALRRHFVLSSPCPLDISVNLNAYQCFGVQRMSSPRLLELLEALIVHSARWRSMTIRGTALRVQLFFELLSRHSVNLEMLESLTIGPAIYRVGGDDEQVLALDTIDLALPPSLHTCNINITFDAFNTAKVHWIALTSFSGPFEGPASFQAFLNAAANLVSLSVMCIGDLELDQPEMTVVHGNLRFLEITLPCGMSLALDKVTFPGLEELSISCGAPKAIHYTCPSEELQDWEAVIIRLMQRATSKITTLSLGETVTLASNLTPILQMPSITSLEITHRDNNVGSDLPDLSRFIDSLTITPSSRLLPALRKLKMVTYANANHFGIHAQLQAMIRSRWDTTCTTERMEKLSLCYMFPLVDVEPHKMYSASMLALFLLELQDKGLDVSWEICRKDILSEARADWERFL